MRQMMRANVEQKVVKKNLCCGCGVCGALCPVEECITMNFDRNLEYKPFINPNLCTRCGVCLFVCPDDTQANAEVQDEFQKKHPETIRNKLLGSFLGCYVGYVTDVQKRRSSASGGVLTAILEELLKKDKVKAVALATEACPPRFFAAGLVDTIKELDRNRGSKYYPIEYSRVLKTIRSQDCPCAVVALPCVALAIRKSQVYDRRLRANIKYVLSPMCGHNVSAAYTEYLVRTNGINPQSVVTLNYRDKTGILEANDFSLAVTYTDQQGRKIKRLGFHTSNVGKTFNSYMFVLNKCLYCSDFAGEFSDASFADAWLPPYLHDPNGTSIVIARNLEIKKLIEEGVDRGAFQLRPINANDVIAAEKTQIRFKKELIRGRIRVQKWLHRGDFADYGVRWQEASILHAIRENWRIWLRLYLSRWCYRNRLLKRGAQVLLSV